MKQAIAGLTPSTAEEATVMVVWPSIAQYAWARWFGIQYENKLGTYIFTVGNMVALLSSPFAAVMYFYRMARCPTYVLTSRRIVEKSFDKEIKAVELGAFESITIDELPGQKWYYAGDLVFRSGDEEVFRLEAVSRPEAFRQTCLKSNRSFVGVKQALSRETVPA
ncbi:MAG: PH domain-containing protein [Pirellulaceae bacterium]